MKSNKVSAIAFIAALSLGLTDHSKGAITLLFTQNGSDVVLTATGSLSLVGLTKTTAGATLGATNILDSTNEQLQIGSGTNQPVDRFTLVVKSLPFNSASNITGALNSWSSNSNSIRFQQNNGYLLIDDAFAAGDTVTVDSQITFANRTLSEFGLIAGTSVVFLENESDAGPAADGQVIVTAVPEPTSAVLLGLGGLALILRRRKFAA